MLKLLFKATLLSSVCAVSDSTSGRREVREALNERKSQLLTELESVLTQLNVADGGVALSLEARTAANASTGATDYKADISDCGGGKLACTLQAFDTAYFSSAHATNLVPQATCKHTIDGGTLRMSSEELSIQPTSGSICSTFEIQLDHGALGHIGSANMISPGCPLAANAPHPLKIDLKMTELGWFAAMLAKSKNPDMTAKLYDKKEQLVLCAKLVAKVL
jgi:hypothetical protein